MSDAPILVSSCLAGIPCRYDARARPDDAVIEAVREGRAIPACAEQLGDLPTPRPAAEIVGGDGEDVLRGTARVMSIDGEDLTAPFVAGAEAVAEIVERHGIDRALLQGRSPSCGCGTIYDGTHSGALVDGDGVLTAVLKRRGLSIEPVRGRRQE
ncbi:MULTISPECIES: DUF523 domain-containing protein [unclassified Leucobacter]|uniref:DUF523 domain-containing protein n=1 Tax=unclassified Leucobacter TaxID=2621730 RepID=UPI0006216382|nr:DUF523 domain-containing protein [Leucobacter sp. Ag1]KKI21739.1 hypothetical protein XM48_04265 [Leucobacter sp. Ag1]